MKIVIGVMAESIESEKSFFLSFHNSTEKLEHEISLVVINTVPLDQTEMAVRDLSCRKLHAEFLSSEEPPMRLLQRYAREKEAEVCFLFPSKIYLFCPGLIQGALYFFERNHNVGLVGFKSINARGFHDHGQDWQAPPVVIEEPYGPFAIQMTAMEQLDHIDGNDWGMQLAVLNRYSYVLNWPPVFNRVAFPDPSPSVKKPEGLTFWLAKDGSQQSAVL